MPSLLLSLKISLDGSRERIFMQNNNIIDFLDLEDANVRITNIEISGDQKIITLETVPYRHYCPVCGSLMHSRGLKTRMIHHPILQDTYELVIKLRQRRWKCTNDICGYELNESFNFVSKYQRYTNASEILIVREFKNLYATARDIADKFHTSDSNVLNIFDKYVNMQRLPLSDAISIDEVYLNMDDRCKYVLVIQDFYTGNIIDLIHSRQARATLPYFASIPKEERNRVRYLISDMYNPYLEYPKKYFPNAVSVVDSFHVIQWINHSIDEFLRSLLNQFKERDAERKARLEMEAGHSLYIPMSDEVYLLQNYKWLMLKNQSNILYHQDPRIDKHFRYYMNTYDYEYQFYQIHPALKELHSLKEEYVNFNERNAGDPEKASAEIDILIDKYLSCDHDMFHDFGRLLKKYREPIINSFVMVSKIGPGNIEYETRLSNGPIESLNRKAKDLKRMGRGYRNFSHLRNRFLYATRDRTPLDGTEKDEPKYIEYDDQFTI